jgi:hypothetical protein
MAFLRFHPRFVLLALPGLVIVSAVQASCTARVESPGIVQQGTTCAASDTSATVAGQAVCCGTADSSGQLPCAAPGAPRVGAACTPVGTTLDSMDGYAVTLDTCVAETCAGDRNAQSFADTTVHTHGTLVCTSRGWQFSTTADVHTVTRVCSVTSTVACAGSGYDGYGYGGGYGYYSTPAAVPVRSVSVVTSTCAIAGGTAQPCAANGL